MREVVGGLAVGLQKEISSQKPTARSQQPLSHMPVRVALVEDNERIRHRFLARLRFFDDVTFVFAAESGEACLRKMALLPPEERPEVVLMDIGLPQMSGIETTVRLKEDHPGLGVADEVAPALVNNVPSGLYTL